jgi:hypothetical protein
MTKIQIHLLLVILVAAQFSYSQTYQYYAGNLHAHTGYSDGNKDVVTTHVGTPKGSFDYARKSEHFDFLGISEHNHSGAKMKLANYAKGLKEAEQSTTTKFLGLYGMEYGVISQGGHVLIYGVNELIGWEPGNFDVECPKSNYKELWNLLAAYPNAFATLAHPEKTDYQNLFSAPYSKTADKVICGVAIMTGPAFAEETDYSRKASKKFIDYFRSLLATGYHIGPTVDHDNHFLTFGSMASSRTMVLSKKLDKKSIMEAYRAMRFYATTDWNAYVTFEINGFPMGKMINTKTSTRIKVSVRDDDPGDDVAAIKVMYGEPGSGTLSTQLTKGAANTLEYTDDVPKGKERYYYLEITQKDGDKIYTSPIWVRRVN